MQAINSIVALIRKDWRAQVVALIIALIIVYFIFRTVQKTDVEARIEDAARKQGMPENMQRMLVAQAKHETGNFTSNAYLQDNNLYGYKCLVSNISVHKSCGRGSSEGNPYAHYDKIEDSVIEICNWIKRRISEGKIPNSLSAITIDTYAQYLKNAGYYGDTVANYTMGLKKYYA